MEDKKQKILAMAHVPFRRNGFHDVGIDKIRSKSGVAKMTVQAFRVEAQLDREGTFGTSAVLP